MTKARHTANLVDANGDVKTTALDNVPNEVAVSASAPGSPSEGDLWYDTQNEILKVYHDGESAFVKVVRVIPTLDAITGDIVNGAASNLTLTGTGFLSANLTVGFTPSGGSATNVTVTPASDTSAVVAVPSAIYGQSIGTSIGVKVTNSDNRGSGTLTKTVAAQAVGGTEVTTGGYKYHTFTSSGNFVLSAAKNIEYIMVAGGGSSGRYGGGGGAGGMLAGSVSSLSPNTYPIVIGAGGVHTGANPGADNGDDTTFNSLTAIGGGRGATGGNNGYDGGSGGGGSYAGTTGGNGTSGQGNNGGGSSYSNPYPSGGGGGKGAAGGNASSSTQAGNGGNGINTYSAWATATSTGDSGYYAGGGAGGIASGSGYTGGGSGGTGGQGGGGNGGAGGSGQQAGQANTGGGGGSGAYNGSSSTAFPTNGGSGIVIIRYSA